MYLLTTAVAPANKQRNTKRKQERREIATHRQKQTKSTESESKGKEKDKTASTTTTTTVAHSSPGWVCSVTSRVNSRSSVSTKGSQNRSKCVCVLLSVPCCPFCYSLSPAECFLSLTIPCCVCCYSPSPAVLSSCSALLFVLSVSHSPSVACVGFSSLFCAPSDLGAVVGQASAAVDLGGVFD